MAPAVRARVPAARAAGASRHARRALRQSWLGPRRPRRTASCEPGPGASLSVRARRPPTGSRGGVGVPLADLVAGMAALGSLALWGLALHLLTF